jgi:hypothetical protein
MRYECPLIAVPNPTLLGNHQAETANNAAAQGLAIAGALGQLHEALHEARVLTAKRNLDLLPPYRDPPFPVPERDRRTLLDWTLLTCYPDELARKLEGREGGADKPRVSNVSMDTAIDSLDAYDRKLALDCLKSG